MLFQLMSAEWQKALISQMSAPTYWIIICYWRVFLVSSSAWYRCILCFNSTRKVQSMYVSHGISVQDGLLPTNSDDFNKGLNGLMEGKSING